MYLEILCKKQNLTKYKMPRYLINISIVWLVIALGFTIKEAVAPHAIGALNPLIKYVGDELV